MKRLLLICTIILTIYACKKQAADAVYDTHLFAQLNAHNWVFDSARITDSTLRDTSVYAQDTATQVTSFAGQTYAISIVKDTMILDSSTNTVKDTVVVNTTNYQVTYDNPDKIYYYAEGGLLIQNQYLTIATVTDTSLILNGLDTLKNVSVNYYHAQ